MLHDLTLLAPKPVIDIAPTRRQSLGTTAAVALLASVMTTGVGRKAFAADFSNDQKLMLLRVARDIYPHDPSLIDDKYYQATVDAIVGEAGKDAKVADMVTKGLADLDARANAAHKTGYMGVKEYEKREGILRQSAKVVSDDVGIIPLFHYRNIWAAKKGLKVTPFSSDRTTASMVTKVAP